MTEAKGNCNCGSITVTLAEQPSSSMLCHCKNCRRAGAGPFTVNYYIDLSSINLQDPKGVLKSYTDSNTISGNTIVRKFCGECGSPVMSVISPDAEKVVLKGGLFDYMPEPTLEGFETDKLSWIKIPMASEAGKKL